MSKPKGNPWRAARARVWFEQGWWHYTVTNWHGRIVAHDNAGGRQGRAKIFTAAAKTVEAVRLMDGMGQGKHMVEIDVTPPPVVGSGSPARDCFPERFPIRPRTNWKPWS